MILRGVGRGSGCGRGSGSAGLDAPSFTNASFTISSMRADPCTFSSLFPSTSCSCVCRRVCVADRVGERPCTAHTSSWMRASAASSTVAACNSAPAAAFPFSALTRSLRPVKYAACAAFSSSSLPCDPCGAESSSVSNLLTKRQLGSHTPRPGCQRGLSFASLELPIHLIHPHTPPPAHLQWTWLLWCWQSAGAAHNKQPRPSQSQLREQCPHQVDGESLNHAGYHLVVWLMSPWSTNARRQVLHLGSAPQKS